MTDPIPTSARVPFWFTPLSQDAARVEREGFAALKHRERALEALIEASYFPLGVGEQPGPDRVKEIEDERAAIEGMREVLKIKVDAIREKFPNPQRFLLAVPTPLERDNVHARMIRLGLRQISIEQMRAATVEELWGIDWDVGGVGTHENDTKAEEHANFLDSIWQRQEAQEEADSIWREQETQRALDIAAGAPHREPDPMPVKIIAVRDTALLTSLVERVTQSSQRLRDLAAEASDFNRRNAVLQCRMQLKGVENFPAGVQVVIDPRTGVATEECVNAIRNECSDLTWAELNDQIVALYNLSGEEEKNSVSPLGNPSTRNSSVEPSGALASSDGTSTASSISPAPAAESATITDPSSFTTTGSAGPESTAAVPIPTVAPSSTSQSD